MGDHPTAAAFREAFTSGDPADPDAFRAMLADDVVWHQIGGATINGADEVVATMSGLGEVDFNLDLHDVVSNDDHTVALMEVTISMGDESFNYRTAEIYHVADGKVTERWAFSDDSARISAFFDSLG